MQPLKTHPQTSAFQTKLVGHAATHRRRRPLKCDVYHRQYRDHALEAAAAHGQAQSGPQLNVWLSKVLAGAVSLGLLFQGGPAAAEELSIAFPASTNPEIRKAQQTLVESWAYVQALYLDPSFSHTDWAKALQDALAASFKAGSAADVTQLTQDLLASLDDPYTRLLAGDDKTALEAEEQGKVVATGMGLQQVVLMPPTEAAAAQEQPSTPEPAAAAADAAAGGGGGQAALVVSFVVDGSPAAAAGVAEGDLLLEVGGQPVAAQQLRQIYKLLSKEADVTLLRRPTVNSSSSSASQGLLPSLQLPPVVAVANSGSSSDNSSSSSSSSSDVKAAAAQAGYSPTDTYTVHLKAEPLEFAPVQYGIIDINKAVESKAASSSSDGSSDGSSSSSSFANVAYLKLLTFSASAPQEVAEALTDIQKEQQQGLTGQQQGLAGLILDLRDNPGGIVEAGVDIAQDFLSEGQVLCIAVDKSQEEERVVLPAAHTLTNLPLVVLVNHSTASTSELLAGALHDELSAPLIGTTTYGKGRSQRVVPLSDGNSTLLVSTLKYFTPKHTEIDKQGLQPDVVCDPQQVLGQQWTGGRVGGEEEVLSLLDDPCVRLAAARLSGAAL